MVAVFILYFQGSLGETDDKAVSSIGPCCIFCTILISVAVIVFIIYYGVS